MKSDFFKVALIVSLALGSAKAMMEDEESSKHTQCKLVQKKSSKTKSPLSSEVPMESLSDELLLTIFTFVEIPDLGKLSQVSTRWNKITETPSLWKFMGDKYYGDFLSPDDLATNPKQMGVSHYLRVVVNQTANLREIDRLVCHYQLHLYDPLFKQGIEAAVLYSQGIDLSSCEELIVQGNEYFIERKIEGLNYGKNGYVQDLEAAREFNELLIQRGDQKAIKRKIEGLTCGGEKELRYLSRPNMYSHLYPSYKEEIDDSIEICCYGYKKDLSALKKFQELLIIKEEFLEELLIKKGDQKAIGKKIIDLVCARGGLTYYLIGTKAMNRKIKRLNELLVEKGNPEAIGHKIRGLVNGTYGYEKDLEAARSLIESLVERGDRTAIEIKINALQYGQDGYEKDRGAAKRLNESLVEKGDREAIGRKIAGFNVGGSGYEKDWKAARSLIESLVEKGDLKATWRKIENLSYGNYGYEKDMEAARSLIEFLVEKGNPEAIKRKLDGLIKGEVGYERNPYEKNPSAAKEFIESLVTNKNPGARGIGKYIKAFALKYGIAELGYEKDRKKAIDFIKENHVPY